MDGGCRGCWTVDDGWLKKRRRLVATPTQMLKGKGGGGASTGAARLCDCAASCLRVAMWHEQSRKCSQSVDKQKPSMFGSVHVSGIRILAAVEALCFWDHHRMYLMLCWKWGEAKCWHVTVPLQLAHILDAMLKMGWGEMLTCYSSFATCTYTWCYAENGVRRDVDMLQFLCNLHIYLMLCWKWGEAKCWHVTVPLQLAHILDAMLKMGWGEMLTCYSSFATCTYTWCYAENGVRRDVDMLQFLCNLHIYLMLCWKWGEARCWHVTVPLQLAHILDAMLKMGWGEMLTCYSSFATCTYTWCYAENGVRRNVDMLQFLCNLHIYLMLCWKWGEARCWHVTVPLQLAHILDAMLKMGWGEMLTCYSSFATCTYTWCHAENGVRRDVDMLQFLCNLHIYLMLCWKWGEARCWHVTVPLQLAHILDAMLKMGWGEMLTCYSSFATCTYTWCYAENGVRRDVDMLQFLCNLHIYLMLCWKWGEARCWHVTVPLQLAHILDAMLKMGWGEMLTCYSSFATCTYTWCHAENGVRRDVDMLQFLCNLHIYLMLCWKWGEARFWNVTVPLQLAHILDAMLKIGWGQMLTCYSSFATCTYTWCYPENGVRRDVEMLQFLCNLHIYLMLCWKWGEARCWHVTVPL